MFYAVSLNHPIGDPVILYGFNERHQRETAIASRPGDMTPILAKDAYRLLGPHGMRSRYSKYWEFTYHWAPKIDEGAMTYLRVRLTAYAATNQTPT